MSLRYLLIILFVALACVKAMATHMSGGEIYWECIGPNTYRIKLVVYRDCAGINVDASTTLQLSSPCGNRTLTVTHSGATEISQLCDLELPNSTCNGGTLPGIQQYTYTGTLVLPPCNSWSIRWTNIYRNNAIVNLNNPGSQELFIEAVLNNAVAPCNDSPIFTNTAIPYVCLGYPVSFSYGAFDPEGDSLSYALIGARRVGGNPIAYVAPNTPAEPIPGLVLDPATGLINFTLNVAGNWVVVVRVTQYNSAGQVMGTVLRDMQFVAYPCDNIPPDAATGLVTNLTGTAVQTGPRAVEVCESGDFCFEMVINDVNETNILTAFSNIQQNLPGATFSYTGTNPITAQVCWEALPNTAGFFPFIVNVNDGACPIPAIQTYVYSVRVRPGVFATLEAEDESCLGSANGSLSTLISAGTSPFIYTWSTGSDEASIIAGPGEYDVIIEDAYGCISHPISGTIGTAAYPNEADAGGDFVVCADAYPIQLSGTVVNATEGVWSGGNGVFTGTGLDVEYIPDPQEILSGSVQLTLTTTNNEGCPPASDDVIITLPDSFTDAAITSVDATCYGYQNGLASFTPADPSFTYQWDDAQAQTTATAAELGAGTYNVTVTDAFGCTITLPAAIGPNEPLTILEIETTDETCLGLGDGSAMVNITGGTAPYSFEWNNGATGQTFTGTAGTYTIAVTDANGCAPAFADVTIEAAAEPNMADAGGDQLICMGAFPVVLSGTVVNATSGTWSGGSGEFTGTGTDVGYMPSAEEIASGEVMLTFTTTGNDACPPAADEVLIQITNSFADGMVNITNATCSDVNDGSASFTPDLPQFTYAWDDPQAQTTATATGLNGGTVNVTVTDEFGCTITLSAIMDPPAALSIAEIITTDETCLGTADGTATVVPAGGTWPYFYTWSDGGADESITATSGTYTVSITDANGCTPALGEAIIGAAAFPNEAHAGGDLVYCPADVTIQLNGSVVNAPDGVWSGGSEIFNGTGPVVGYFPSVADVQAGSVTLTLTTVGNEGCPPASDEMVILIPNSFIDAEVTAVDATCNDVSDGSASFSPADPSFTYEWEDLAATTATVTGLGAGTYNVLVTDQYGCSISLPAEIGPMDPVSIVELTSTDEICLGDGSGSASVTVTGGTAPYVYTWSNGDVDATIAATSGTYTVSITDANGCAPAMGEVIIAPTALPNEADAGGDLVYCPEDISIQLNGSVVNAPDAIWSGGSEIFSGPGAVVEYFPSAMDVLAGSVTLTLTTVGNEGCPPASDELVILIPNSFIDAQVTSVDATCNDLSDGSAGFSPEDPAFTYEWDVFSASTATVTGLGAGTYNILVTDPYGCSISLPAEIGPPGPIAIVDLTSEDETCLGSGDGAASVVVTGGTAPYVHAWSNGDTEPTITATSGSYTVTITDANGCTPAAGEVIIAPAALPNSADAGADQIACMDMLTLALNGQIENATGGTWTGGNGTFSGSGLNVLYTIGPDDIAAGTVMLTLTTTGNEGCPPASDDMLISIPNSFANGTVTTIDATCYELSNGQASYSPADPSFSYAWNDPLAQATSTAVELSPGDYILTVTDVFGCSTSLPAFIGPASPITIAELISESENCVGSGDGNASVVVTGGTAPYTYFWSNGSDQPTITGPSGDYTVSISDVNGCAPTVGEISISSIGLPNIADAGNDVLVCLNTYPIQLQGSVTNAASGTWSGGNGVIDGDGLSAEYWPTVAEILNGNVELVLTTVGNETCPAATDTMQLILANAFINASIAAENASCNGFADGTLTFSPDNSALSYVWNAPGAGNGPVASGLMAGTYSVIVTDALGCDSTFHGTITEPDSLLFAAINTVDVTCNNGSDGQATVEVTGGTAPYTASWSTGANSMAITGLIHGDHVVSITDANGCIIQDTASIGQPDAITMQMSIPDTVCVNTPVLLTATAQGGNGGYQFTWGGLGTGDSLLVEFPASQFVQLSVSDSAGCSAPSLIEPVYVLDLALANFSVYGNATVCAGEEVTIGATVSGYSGGHAISWPDLPATGPGPFTFPLDSSMTVQVILSNSCNDHQIETITLVVDVPTAVQLPAIIAQGCAPLTVQFPAPQLPNGTWVWDLGNGQTSGVASPTVVYQAGIYTATLTVTTPFGCSSTTSSSGQIISHATPSAAFTASAYITDLDNALILFTDQSTGNITSHSWNFGDGGTSGTMHAQNLYTDIGTYQVDLTVQNANGCASTASQHIQITPVYDITLPNAFTPNLNGGTGGSYSPYDLNNDVFYAFVKHVDDFRMRIYNRWGELVFESDDLMRGWDGYYRNQLSPQDVYVVQTWIRFIDGHEIQKLSDLTLLR